MFSTGTFGTSFTSDKAICIAVTVTCTITDVCVGLLSRYHACFLILGPTEQSTVHMVVTIQAMMRLLKIREMWFSQKKLVVNQTHFIFQLTERSMWVFTHFMLSANNLLTVYTFSAHSQSGSISILFWNWTPRTFLCIHRLLLLLFICKFKNTTFV